MIMTEFYKNSLRFLKVLFLTTVLLSCVYISRAQPVLPQRTLTVTATQAIHFGTLCRTGGAGGTVVLHWDGTRTATGDLELLSISPTSQPAIFEIKLCQGRNIIITFSPTATLTGPGGSLTLDIGPTEQGGNTASFSSNNDCDFITPLRVGGTLHVPGTALPGIYTGSFAITFNQE